MGYLKTIRKSFESIFIPRESSTNVQQQLQQPTHNRTKLRFTKPYINRQIQRGIMPGSPRPTSSSSDESGRRMEKQQSFKYTPRAAGYDRGTITGDGMLPTPETSSLKRKRGSKYTGYDHVEDGPALLDDTKSGKRLCVSAGFQPLSPLSSPLGTLPLSSRADDVVFNADTEPVSDRYNIDGYTESGSEEVDITLHGDTLISSQTGDCGKDIDGDNLSETNESDESISELSSESSLGDSDDDTMLSLPGQRPPGGRGFGSKRSDESEAPYRPSPALIIKNLQSSIVPQDGQETDASEDDLWSENTNVQKSERKEVDFDFSMEKAKRWAAAVQLPPGVWADAERDLIIRLSMRGFEPMLPSNWRLDFPTLPDSLFAAFGSDDGLLLPSSSSEFRAIKYFDSLLLLTGRVRDRLVCRLRPEPVIHHAIKSYTEWALRDAGQHFRPSPIPLFSVYSLKPFQSTSKAVRIINRRLVCLANRHRDASRLATSIEIDPESDNHTLDISQMYADRIYPVLTGFVICGSIVAIITLNSDPKINPVLDSTTSSKFIAQFDLSESGQGVWNALAIAITAVRTQKTLGELEECWGGCMSRATNAPVSEDVDA